jgi:hypothetical protein
MFLSILSTVKARCQNIRTSIAVDPSFKVDPIIVSGDIPDYAKDGNAIKVVVSYFKGVDKTVSEELSQLNVKGLRFWNLLIKFMRKFRMIK